MVLTDGSYVTFPTLKDTFSNTNSSPVYPAGMCSSRGLCGNSNRPNRSSSSEGSGAHYALCALGVGLIALGIVMVVWTVMPMDGGGSTKAPALAGNSTTLPPSGNDEAAADRTKSSSVALVLVGVGGLMLFLSICLGIRSKSRARSRADQPAAAAAVPIMGHAAREQP